MNTDRTKSNRSQVQGSTFWVKDKEGIEDQKSSFTPMLLVYNAHFPK